MKETIAIVAWGAMADVLYATPIVKHIRQIHPNEDISWLIRDKFAQVINDNPHIDHVVNFTLPEGYETRQDAEYIMDKSILQYANDRYDRVYDLQYWPRHSNFYERPNEDFISLRARNAGLDPDAIKDRSVVLKISEKDERDALLFMFDRVGDPDQDGLTPPFITVNHISYAASPVWAFDNYAKLVEILRNQYGVISIFTGAPNEPIPENCIDARGMPYMQWASLIDNSNLWLGLDSGAVALACASEVPIIKLHSPDFPLAKTGIRAMGLRNTDVLELSPAPNAETLAGIIVRSMHQ